MHVRHDGPDVFCFLLRRIGIVHADVADAAELASDPEVETDRFRVADVQITIRLGRKARDDLLVFSGAQILRDDVADEVRRSFCFSRHRSGQSYRRTCRSTTRARNALLGSARLPACWRGRLAIANFALAPGAGDAERSLKTVSARRRNEHAERVRSPDTAHSLSTATVVSSARCDERAINH